MTDTKLREALRWIAVGHKSDHGGVVSGHPGLQRVGADARNVARAALDAAPEADAAATERAAVVRWLRGLQLVPRHATDRLAKCWADCLEQGRHLDTPPPTRRSPEEIAREVCDRWTGGVDGWVDKMARKTLAPLIVAAIRADRGE